MPNMRHTILAAATLLFLALRCIAAEPRPAAQFVVAEAGDDSNPGTVQKPFATLARRRNAVRQLIAAGLQSDVNVLICYGRYTLSEPLVFGPEDSGSEKFAVTYAGDGVFVKAEAGRSADGSAEKAKSGPRQCRASGKANGTFAICSSTASELSAAGPPTRTPTELPPTQRPS